MGNLVVSLWEFMGIQTFNNVNHKQQRLLQMEADAKTLEKSVRDLRRQVTDKDLKIAKLKSTMKLQFNSYTAAIQSDGDNSEDAITISGDMENTLSELDLAKEERKELKTTLAETIRARDMNKTKLKATRLAHPSKLASYMGDVTLPDANKLMRDRIKTEQQYQKIAAVVNSLDPDLEDDENGNTLEMILAQARKEAHEAVTTNESDHRDLVNKLPIPASNYNNNDNDNDNDPDGDAELVPV